MRSESFSILGMYSDFAFQWQNLIFLLVPVLKAAYDVFYTEAKHFPVIHKRSLALAIVLGIILSYIDFKTSIVHHYAQSAILGIAIFWIVFDYLRNFFAGKKIFFIEADPATTIDNSWVELNVYAKLPSPIAWLFFKIVVLLAAFGTYYFASYIPWN